MGEKFVLKSYLSRQKKKKNLEFDNYPDLQLRFLKFY